MEIFFGVIIAGIFLYINFLIIKKDIQEKIIPNKYLGYLLFLLPLWYIYWWFYGYFEEVNLISFILQIGIACIIWFLLFHFWKWWAGDAKYICVLYLYFSFWINVFDFIIGTIFIWSIFFFITHLWVIENIHISYEQLYKTIKVIWVKKISRKILNGFFILFSIYLFFFFLKSILLSYLILIEQKFWLNEKVQLYLFLIFSFLFIFFVFHTKKYFQKIFYFILSKIEFKNVKENHIWTIKEYLEIIWAIIVILLSIFLVGWEDIKFILLYGVVFIFLWKILQLFYQSMKKWEEIIQYIDNLWIKNEKFNEIREWTNEQKMEYFKSHNINFLYSTKVYSFSHFIFLWAIISTATENIIFKKIWTWFLNL